MAEVDLKGFLSKVSAGHAKAEANILYRLDPDVKGVPYADLVQRVQGAYPGARIDHIEEDDSGMLIYSTLKEETTASAFLKQVFRVDSGVPDAGPIDVTLTAQSFDLALDIYHAEIVPNGNGWKMKIQGRKGDIKGTPDREPTFDLQEPKEQPRPRALTYVEEALLALGRAHGFETEQSAAA